ncbi:DNA polymerase III subunit delta' [Ligilactobacillus sp. LYQ139]|uniref:DNA polymerase III subunit delta' n=1 Tax=Ligilactobacillus sp. LYQ139 TaxID=3378800 RepID=UPI003852FECE
MTIPVTTKHPHLTAHFARLAREKKLAHAYLFTGATGAGKTALARWVAQACLCARSRVDGQPCGQCDECVRIQQDEHPDVLHIVPDGQTIKVNQIRFLRSEFSKSGVEGLQKFFIISEAEKMTASAANSLLKFLEEPSGQVTAFLLSAHPQQILTTIVSRCQVVKVAPPTVTQLRAVLREAGAPEDFQTLLPLITRDQQVAMRLAGDPAIPKLITAIKQWFTRICQGDYRAFVAVQTRLIPETPTSELRSVAVALVVQLTRALLLTAVSARDEVPVFPDLVPLFKRVAARVSQEQLTVGVTAALGVSRQLAANVSFQNAFEGLTLRLITVLH